jgi:hypothetical protein
MCIPSLPVDKAGDKKLLTILQFELIVSKEFIYPTKFQAVHMPTWTSKPYRYSMTFVAILTAKQ